MTLIIHRYTAKICLQWLDSKGRYKYTQKDIDLKELIQDELDHIHKQGQEILTLIEEETFRRANELRTPKGTNT